MMLFQTPNFLAFFAIFMALYTALNKSLRHQNVLLLLASYIFYAAWDVRFLLLIAGCTQLAFIAGLGISQHPRLKELAWRSLAMLSAAATLILLFDPSRNLKYLIVFWGACALMLILAFSLQCTRQEIVRRVYLWICISGSLAVLAYFKYANFFISQLKWLLELSGTDLDIPTTKIILPVGISFYTFQAIGYTIDVYKNRVQACEDAIEFYCFIAFFPQVLAGPIHRATFLLPQLAAKRELTLNKSFEGLCIFAWGAFKKKVVADRMTPMVSALFASGAQLQGGDVLAGALAFAFQIYGDFSGYSDMARGIGRIMGFDVMQNFDIPYFAKTPAEFWKRWHISLSSWLRDYLYIPLGGNRSGELRTYWNLMTTMVLGGLWHGASWTFIVWGAYHGAVLCIYRILRAERAVERLCRKDVGGAFSGFCFGAILFVLVALGWLPFRAPNLAACSNLGKIVLSKIGFESAYWVSILPSIGALLAFECYQYLSNAPFPWVGRSKILNFHVLCVVVFGVLLIKAPGAREFIYFDF